MTLKKSVYLFCNAVLARQAYWHYLSMVGEVKRHPNKRAIHSWSGPNFKQNGKQSEIVNSSGFDPQFDLVKFAWLLLLQDAYPNSLLGELINSELDTDFGTSINQSVNSWNPTQNNSTNPLAPAKRGFGWAYVSPTRRRISSSWKRLRCLRFRYRAENYSIISGWKSWACRGNKNATGKISIVKR